MWIKNERDFSEGAKKIYILRTLQIQKSDQTKRSKISVIFTSNTIKIEKKFRPFSNQFLLTMQGCKPSNAHQIVFEKNFFQSICQSSVK